MTPESPKPERASSNPWALVCQGGGGKGAWQAGFIDEAVRRFGADFKTCLGTSVGALNGALYLQSLQPTHTDILEVVWTSTGAFDILCRPTLREILRGGIFGHGKLLDLMRRYARPSDIELVCTTRLKYLIVFTSTSGDSYPFIFGPAPAPGAMRSHDGFSSLHGALLASSAIPVAFPYVQQNAMDHFDGGLRKNNPMEEALQTGLNEILVLSPTCPESLTQGRTLVEYLDPIHTQLLRAGEKVQRELGRRATASAKYDGVLPVPKVYFVTPSEPIPSWTTLVFSRESSRRLFELGRRDAREFFASYRTSGAAEYDFTAMQLISPDSRRPMLNILGLVLNIIGSVLLAYAIKIAPSTEVYGQSAHMELGGKEVQFATANPKLFYVGLVLLIGGFVASLVSEIRTRRK